MSHETAGLQKKRAQEKLVWKGSLRAAGKNTEYRLIVLHAYPVSLVFSCAASSRLRFKD